MNNILQTNIDAFKARPTFVFCANDNMALGARAALSNAVLDDCKKIRIICFDASAFIKMHIDLSDRFLWRAIDQQYWEIVNKSFEIADKLFKGIDVDKKVHLIEPKVYKRD